jgi:hypothetical protein
MALTSAVILYEFLGVIQTEAGPVPYGIACGSVADYVAAWLPEHEWWSTRTSLHDAQARRGTS